MGGLLDRLGQLALHNPGSEGILLAEVRISYFRCAFVGFVGLRLWFA